MNEYVIYLPVDYVMQVLITLVAAGFVGLIWHTHRKLEVSGAVGNASRMFLLGSVFVLISEVMDFAVVQAHQPFGWAKLYSVAPQVAGFLFIFLGLTKLFRTYEVFESE